MLRGLHCRTYTGPGGANGCECLSPVTSLPQTHTLPGLEFAPVSPGTAARRGHKAREESVSRLAATAQTVQGSRMERGSRIQPAALAGSCKQDPPLQRMPPVQNLQRMGPCQWQPQVQRGRQGATSMVTSGAQPQYQTGNNNNSDKYDKKKNCNKIETERRVRNSGGHRSPNHASCLKMDTTNSHQHALI